MPVEPVRFCTTTPDFEAWNIVRVRTVHNWPNAVSL
jgi:hypothetical protein